MRPRTLAEVARLIGGRPQFSDPGRPVSGASIDSRLVEEGELFFAIRGERDGVEFAPAALRAGAVAAVVPSGAADRFEGNVIEVDDPRTALGRLAGEVRRQEAESVLAVAITGSVGKTTACRYAATLLSGLGPTHRPPASFNNDLGVPLTILGAPAETRVLVIEIGSNAPGEVASLGRLTAAHVVAVTAIAPVHLEGFGSLEGVAREKLSLLDAVPSTAEAWLPTEFADRAGASGLKVRTFGPAGVSEVRSDPRDPQRHTWIIDGRPYPFDWNPRYRHQRELLAATLGLGVSLGAEPGAMLARVRELAEPPLRGEVECCAGVDLLLDCYNANPVALEAAIERLEDEPAPGRRVCVVGTMEELGTEEAHWHRSLGRRLGAGGIDTVYVLGRGAPWYREGMREAGRDARPLAADEAGAHHLAGELRPGDRVLFKASRLEALETFAARVEQLLTATGRNVSAPTGPEREEATP